MSNIDLGDVKDIDIDWQSFAKRIERFSMTTTFQKGVRLQVLFDRKTATKLKNQLTKLLDKKSKV